MTAAADNCRPGATRLRITSDPANASTVRQLVGSVARACGFAEGDVAALTLAIDEAVCNVIKHAYEGSHDRPIDVLIEPLVDAGREGIAFTITDEGRQVDPSTIVGRDLEELRPGGLGTHIIRTVMDEVEYTRRECAGMCLRLVKWKASCEASTELGS